jgi:hypothetical protein
MAAVKIFCQNFIFKVLIRHTCPVRRDVPLLAATLSHPVVKFKENFHFKSIIRDTST